MLRTAARPALSVSMGEASTKKPNEWKYVKGISVVERLGSQELVEILSTTHRLAVVDVGIRLDNPQELLAWVVEVELNLVGRRTNRFITSEL